MSDNQSNSKRIAKNALALYVRMFVLMLAGLYTSRVLLNALGVVDYGLNNVVGGFVSMFSLISGTLIASISRFLTFEVGTGNIKKLRELFGTSLYVQTALAVIVVVVAETIGLWFFHNKMVIPTERMQAASWVFHLSIVSFVLQLYTSPYNAVIVAHEKMDAFAYMSLFEAFMKVLIATIISYTSLDKLVLLSSLGFCVGIIVQAVYMTYCKRHFEECTFKIAFSKTEFKRIFSFAGWSSIGSVAGLLRSQGGNILLNLFGGPAVNASAGIASTITGVVNNFVSNFSIAFNPQIIKLYAAKEYTDMMKLVYRGSRFSFYLMFVIALPTMFCGKYIYMLWLGQAPEHTVSFMNLVLIFMLLEALAQPVITAKNATGNIKNYQIVVGGILLMTLPISYGALKFGLPVEWVYVANIITAVFAFVARIYMLRGDIPMWSSRSFVSSVMINALSVGATATILPYIAKSLLPDTVWSVFITVPIAFASAATSILFIGCSRTERAMIMDSVKNVYKKIVNR